MRPSGNASNPHKPDDAALTVRSGSSGQLPGFPPLAKSAAQPQPPYPQRVQGGGSVEPAAIAFTCAAFCRAKRRVIGGLFSFCRCFVNIRRTDRQGDV